MAVELSFIQRKEMLLKFFPKYFSEIPWQRSCSPISEGTSIGITTKKENKNSKQLVLFGASTQGIKALEVFNYEYDSIFFYDNNREKWGKFIKGIEVISTFLLKKLSRSGEVKVSITSMYWREIRSQLLDLGITNFEVFQKLSDYRNVEKWFCTLEIYERLSEILVSPAVKNAIFIGRKKLRKLCFNTKKRNPCCTRYWFTRYLRIVL